MALPSTLRLKSGNSTRWVDIKDYDFYLIKLVVLGSLGERRAWFLPVLVMMMMSLERMIISSWMTTRLVILIERTNKKWPGFRVLLVASRGTCNEHHSHRHHRRPSMKPRRTLMAMEAAMVWRYDEDVLNEIRCAVKTTRPLDVSGLWCPLIFLDKLKVQGSFGQLIGQARLTKRIQVNCFSFQVSEKWFLFQDKI